MYRVLVRKHKATDAIVRPPFEFIRHRGKLKIKNGTSDKIHVTVPDGVFDGKKTAKSAKKAKGKAGAIPVDPGKKLQLIVRSNAEDGAYSFQIFCDETQSYAQANSDPEFIVE